jgi:hypothetical protein
MTNNDKKGKKELEKYLMKIISKYSHKLLLENRIWEVKYGTDKEGSLMECNFNYPYLNVTIKYSDSLVDKWKKKDNIIPFIVHEMCHPITDPLYCKAVSRYVTDNEIKDEREMLTDYICNIVIKNERPR